MMLSNAQKKYLRTLAHDIKPQVMIGQQGLSQAVLTAIEATLKHHELVKIKMRNKDKSSKQQMIDEIVKNTKTHLVHAVGGSITLYRAFAKPNIILPK